MKPRVVIVGGGITGLAAMEALTRTAPDVDATLLEFSTRLGGHIRTDRHDSLVMEAGPDVMLTSKPAGIELARRVGLGDRLQATNPAVRGSYILSHGELRRVPDGLTGLVPSRFGPFVTSPVISLIGKLRVACEYFIPPRAGDDDESIEQFVTRRLGREMYENLVEPLLSGISAGDGGRLSIQAMFPHLRALEREHGGLIRGMLASKRAARGAPTGRRTPPAAPFVSFPGGLEELVAAAASVIEARGRQTGRATIRTRVGVARVEAWPDQVNVSGDGEDHHYVVTLTNGERLAADAVILATPAYATSVMLGGLAPGLARKLAAIEYASTATMSLVYQRSAIPRALDATGYVVPKREGRAVLACTWTSAKFIGRSPDDLALFRLFLGGAGRSGEESLSDDTLRALAGIEMRDVLGISATPLLVRINRFDRALPQYTVGHVGRMAAIAAEVARLPGLDLAGAVYRGVGIPDCVQSGVDAAARALAFVQSPSLTPSNSLP